jgi:hypothetical protein
MKLSNLIAGAALSLVLGMSGAASAAVLYDNGPIDANTDAFTLGYGYKVSNSFTLAQNSTVTGVDFGVWTGIGDTVKTVQWSILSTPDVFPASGSVANVTHGVGTTNSWGYQISKDHFDTGSINLAAGTYYLVMQSATTASGNPVYWDENNGPSYASHSALGNLANYDRPNTTGSESFQILGTSGAVPEPATWAMSLIGVGAIGGALRTRRRQAGQLATVKA